MPRILVYELVSRSCDYLILARINNSIFDIFLGKQWRARLGIHTGSFFGYRVGVQLRVRDDTYSVKGFIGSLVFKFVRNMIWTLDD